MPPNIVEEIKDGLTEIKGGIQEAKLLGEQNGAEIREMRAQLDRLRRGQLGAPKMLRNGLDEDCARYLGALLITAAERQGKLHGNSQREQLLQEARSIFSVHQKAALTTTDIPMPTIFVSQIVELVYQYGQFRQYSTVFPLPTLTTKLPKLSTDPAFGFITMSAAVPEKSPQIAFVTFTAQKAGGIVRIPSELQADSVVDMGAFLGRYVARQMAKWEDTCGFLADGTGTYGSPAINGVGKYADTNGKKVQLTAGNSDPTKITLANMRTLRGQIDSAVLGTSAYYLHPGMEALLVGFNTSATVTPYIPNGPKGPTLDGFPIRWVSVMPVYDTSAHLNQYQVYFGDLSYWYFGDRRELDMAISRDVYFTTDEIGIRALERFDIEAMATDAMAVLQLSAS